MKNLISLLILLVISPAGYGQLRFYSNPLKIPVSVSGDFGELRPNHFHMGMDFKTQHRTGIPVHACADGFVSRIVISPTGYGKVLYVEHPNTTTSVYCHLGKFRDDIAEYVKEEQYRNQSYAVDIKVPSRKFEVNRGDIIAYSGNSGSSQAPHLHFEIRDTKSQDVFNPLIINDFNIKDNIPPRIFSVRIYPLDSRSHVNLGSVPKTFLLKYTGKGYQLNPPIPVKVMGQIGISVKATDYFDTEMSPCGIYSASLTVDSTKIFSYHLQRIPFDQMRYLNSHVDFAQFTRTGAFYQKLWNDRGNILDIYITDKSRGIIQVEDGREYRCEVVLADASGNTSKVVFTLSGKAVEKHQEEKPAENIFHFDSKNSYSAGDFEIQAPKGAFYEDFPFLFSVSKRLPGYYSALYRVNNNPVPIQKPVKIRLLTTGLPEKLENKAVIVRLDGSGMKKSVGGKLSGKWMEASILQFGNFAVACDTISPKILSLSIKNNVLTESSAVRFRISDDLSGIQSYNGYIDDKWVLFEYDAKYSSLVYRIDRDRLGTGKHHTIQLVVKDNVNNQSVYKATFLK